MKTLIAEDDVTSQVLLQELLKPYGTCEVVNNGKDAVNAAKKALDLQTAIFIERVFRDLDCVVKERHLVIAVSARETPAKFKQVMEEIKKNQVKVTEVIYDPRTFNFLLFAKL